MADIVGFPISDARRIADAVKFVESQIGASDVQRRSMSSAPVWVWVKPTGLNGGGLYWDGFIQSFNSSGVLVNYSACQIYSMATDESPPNLNTPYVGRMFGIDPNTNAPKVSVRWLGSDGQHGTYVDVITKLCPGTEVNAGNPPFKPFMLKTYR
jgi:hypothetical protein